MIGREKTLWEESNYNNDDFDLEHDKGDDRPLADINELMDSLEKGIDDGI